jgi:hypothetical protein
LLASLLSGGTISNKLYIILYFNLIGMGRTTAADVSAFLLLVAYTLVITGMFHVTALLILKRDRYVTVVKVINVLCLMNTLL